MSRQQPTPAMNPLVQSLVATLSTGGLRDSDINAYIARGGNAQEKIGSLTLLEFFVSNHTLISNLGSILVVLVRNRADVNHSADDSKKRTVLHNLLSGSFIIPALALVESAGATLDYTKKDAMGQTPLIKAMIGIHKDVALKMIAIIGRKPEVLNAQDNLGMTALHYACLYGLTEIHDALIAAGASKNIKSNDRMEPHKYCSCPHEHIREALKRAILEPSIDETARKNFLHSANYSEQFFGIADPRTNEPFDQPAPIIIPSIKVQAVQCVHLLMLPHICVPCGSRALRPLTEDDKTYISGQVQRMTGVSLMDAIIRDRLLLQNHLSAQTQPSPLVTTGSFRVPSTAENRQADAHAPRSISPQ